MTEPLGKAIAASAAVTTNDAMDMETS